MLIEPRTVDFQSPKDAARLFQPDLLGQGFRATALACRFETGIQEALGLGRPFGPGVIPRSAGKLRREVSEQVRLLGGRVIDAVLRNDHASCVGGYVELASGHPEFGLVHIEGCFATMLQLVH